MPEPAEDHEEPFVAYLMRLEAHPRDGRAAMTALRQAAGLSVGDPTAQSTWRWLLDARRAVEADDLDLTDEGWPASVRFLVATLYATHPLSWPRRDDETGPTHLGASLGRLRILGARREWIDAQFEILILTDRDTIGEYLLPLVGHLAEHRVPVDWSALLRDLMAWPRQRVAYRWALAYYGRPDTAPEDS